MKLKNSLYCILSKAVSDPTISYDIQLDASHFIYQAHFPDNPITPGVCIIQIAKELLEDHLACDLHVIRMKNVKFLQVISPRERTTITYQFDKIVTDTTTGTTQAVVQIMSGETSLTRLSFTCKRR